MISQIMHQVLFNSSIYHYIDSSVIWFINISSALTMVPETSQLMSLKWTPASVSMHFHWIKKFFIPANRLTEIMFHM